MRSSDGSKSRVRQTPRWALEQAVLRQYEPGASPCAGLETVRNGNVFYRSEFAPTVEDPGQLERGHATAVLHARLAAGASAPCPSWTAGRSRKCPSSGLHTPLPLRFSTCV
jgi:hypothetical protein